MVINIPGKRELNVKNVVFDYNGTIAVNGFIKSEIKVKLNELSKILNIYVLTADTYGTAKKECESLGINIRTFPRENAAKCKREILEDLGTNETICVGNGYNDIEMCKYATLSIGVMEAEGICSALISSTDILVRSIEEAIELLLNTNRIIATLRS